MHNCSVTQNLRIVKGSLKDYQRLSHFHYRSPELGPCCAIYAFEPLAGVIVYKMPSLNCEMRNAVLGDMTKGLSTSEKIKWINKNIRCISRVIIEPRYRGLGLAQKLVTETMGLLNVPIIESMAVMGTINPFFEKAGMSAHKGKRSQRCEQIIEAFSTVGIEQQDLINAHDVQEKIQMLEPDKKAFIESEIKTFLKGYVRQRNMKAGIERTNYVLNRITDRPVYYYWINERAQVTK